MRFGMRIRVLLVAAMAMAVPQFWASAGARAQATDNSNSVADAAKQARERQKDAASAKKVITDDDLSPAQLKPGDEGLKTAAPQLETEAPSPAVVAADEAADKKAEKSPADNPLKATDSAKVAAMKEELAKAEEELKLSQREAALDQDTFYSNPDFQHDTAGKEKLADLQQLISNNQQKVDDLRARLAAMQDELSKEGPAGAAETPQSTEENPAPPPQP
jgi:hypothetical protein